MQPIKRPFAKLRIRYALIALTMIGAVVGSSVGEARAARRQTGSMMPHIVTSADGVIRIRSNHDVAETVARVKAAVVAKGVRLFDAIDQQALGKDAGLTTRGSTLVLFGNPPLGVQFLQANPYAGLDWPVRMLVVEEADGSVWLAWTDFAYIARRYHIANRAAQFKMAREVAGSIAADAAQ